MAEQKYIMEAEVDGKWHGLGADFDISDSPVEISKAGAEKIVADLQKSNPDFKFRATPVPVKVVPKDDDFEKDHQRAMSALRRL